jgi:type II secretory pathway pseudopilin PulG
VAPHSRGAALLEVLVALVIVALAGTAVVGTLTAGLDAEGAARARERRLAAAERVLAATTLLRRGELDQRIGDHVVGEFVVRIQRPERSLYRVAIADPASGVEELVTVAFRRPEDLR